MTNAQIISGTYTIVSAKTGDHRTVKIQDDDFAWMTNFKPVAGTRIVAAMTGADNERSFTSIGTLTPNGELRIWKKHEGRADFVAAVKYLLAKGVGNEVEYGKNYAVRSGKCFICNRKLTTPASVHYGYGPDCADNNGFPYDTKAGSSKSAPSPQQHSDNDDEAELARLDTLADRMSTARDNMAKVEKLAMESVGMIGWQRVSSK